MSVITTVPNVSYRAFTKKSPNDVIWVNNPSDLPDPSGLDRVEEPFIKAVSQLSLNLWENGMSLCIEKKRSNY